jgi:Mrp family chromosome partitioning ATPase
MGKVLNTLKQSEGSRSKSAPPPPECVVEWTLDEGEAPFIEVGGPGKHVELSPHLVHPHPPQPRVQPPHSSVVLSEAQPLLVAYEPWPASVPCTIAPEVIAFHQPDHAVSREYAALCAKMLTCTQVAQVLLVTGVRPNVGTSTVLLNLAVTAARAAVRRVALLDANWSRPALAARLGQAAAGVQDVLAGSLALEQAVCATPLPALSLLPAGSKNCGALTSEAAAWLLAWLRERFDVILIDGPPLDQPAALATLAPGCDGMYFVLPQNEGPAQHKELAQALPRLGGRLRGLIHTRFEL